jgi:hypothetical protein
VEQRIPARGKPAAAVFLITGLVLAVFGAAGCSGQAGTSRASVESCVRFGVAAIRHHVTVISLPPACRGLTGAQVDFAADTALRSAAIGARGKARQRSRIVEASRFLEHMFVTVPAQHAEPQAAGPAAGWVSRATFGLIALCTWLIAVALGLWMMTRWIFRSRAPHAPGSRLRRPPALNLAHLGLAGASLLTWIAYLATGVTGVAWAAAALLPLVTGLGMSLVFLSPSAGPADRAADQALSAASAGGTARDGSSRGRRSPVFTTGAHIIFAVATILFAFLAAIGTG